MSESPVRGLVCDLDGVVYRGQQACPGALEGLAAARQAGVRMLFLTNNAARTPTAVAQQLASLGVEASEDEVLTSSQVAAGWLAREYPFVPEGAVVLAVGGVGVGAALQESELAWVSSERAASAHVWAVLQGYGAQVAWADLAEATYAIADGAVWVATNDDATLPTERGLGPGNGALVAAVTHATGRRPVAVVGKPHPPAYAEALRRLDLRAEQVLAVGDRLDTDIAGAKALGMSSALVLTGVSSRADAEQAPAHQRPDTVVDAIPDLASWWG